MPPGCMFQCLALYPNTCPDYYIPLERVAGRCLSVSSDVTPVRELGNCNAGSWFGTRLKVTSSHQLFPSIATHATILTENFAIELAAAATTGQHLAASRAESECLGPFQQAPEKHLRQ